MKLSNRLGLPEAIVRGAMIQNAKYDKGNSDRSVTQLINAPRVDVLRKAYFSETEEDIADSFWALFGSAVHHILEMGIDHTQTAEERLFLDVNGWTISGAIDLQTPVEGGCKLSDYKVTTAYPVMTNEGNGKLEWEQQLNILAYLVERVKNIPVVGVEIVAIIRDWERRKSVTDLNYPAAPVISIPIRLWPREEQEAYIMDRVTRHQQAEFAHEFGEELPECTPEDRWLRGSKWKVLKQGAKRATKTYDNPLEAEAFIDANPGYVIEAIEGKNNRCSGDFCRVSRHCNQWRDIQETANGRDLEANPEA